MVRMIRADIYHDEEGNLKTDFNYDFHNGIPVKYKGKGRGDKSGPYKISKGSILQYDVYSVYPYRGDSQAAMLKEIKQGKMNPADYEQWLKETAKYIDDEIMERMNTDYILTPASSSNLIYDMALELSSSSSVGWISDAFVKNPVDRITLKFPDNASDETIQMTEKLLNDMRKHGKFESKIAGPQRKGYLKYFRNVFRHDEKCVDLLRGKNVAVLDDSISSKGTLFNIFQVCDDVYEVNDCYGITIFKHMKELKKRKS